MADIHQIKVGTTTYDIKDATARDSIYCQYKVFGSLDSNDKISVSANAETRIFTCPDGEGTIPTAFQNATLGIITAGIHSTGAARNQTITFKQGSTVEWYEVHRIGATNDVFVTTTYISQYVADSMGVFITSNVALTNVYGNASAIMFNPSLTTINN